MTKKALDEKYSYQIDEHDVVHLFRGEENCQQHLTNPLLSAIFKIEQLEKENAELKEKLNFSTQYYQGEKAKVQLTKAKEIIKILLRYDRGQFFDDRRIYEKYMHTRGEAEQFLKETKE